MITKVEEFRDKHTVSGNNKGDILITGFANVENKKCFCIMADGHRYSGIRAEWEYLTKTLGVDIVVLDTPILDTTRYKDLLGSVITDIVLAVLSFGAQLEVDTKSKAQAEGIAAAHLKGVKFGRPKCSVKDWDIYYPKWKQGEITAVECYRQLGVSASTFYRLVHKFESEEKAR